jgi:hypothetical protein
MYARIAIQELGGAIGQFTADARALIKKINEALEAKDPEAIAAAQSEFDIALRQLDERASEIIAADINPDVADSGTAAEYDRAPVEVYIATPPRIPVAGHDTTPPPDQISYALPPGTQSAPYPAPMVRR